MVGADLRSVAIRSGTYARKQLYSRSRLVAWSHGSRFDLAARLVSPFAGGRLLDYGCGDGTFVAMVQGRFSGTVGADSDAGQLADCAERFKDLPTLAFVPADSLKSAGHTGRYDVVTCMEVLEHCVEQVREAVIGELRRLVAPQGRVIVSVPIEIGASLVAKQVARRVAAWRHIGDYHHSERYSWPELARMCLAGRGASIPRPVFSAGSSDGEYVYYGHKGFDWRLVERELTGPFDVVARRYSPMPVLSSWLNSQVWFLCRPR